MSKVRIAGVQMDVRLARPHDNVNRMMTHLHTAADHGAMLTIFPECTISGYCFDSFEEAYAVSEPIEGPSFERIAAACRLLGTYVIYGLLEKSESQIYNSAVCVGPAGVVATYRKTHLPGLGVDNFTTAGEGPMELFELPIESGIEDSVLRVGMNICYDCSFPEAARVLTLLGADLIALPTNWPPGSGLVADVIPNTRALENNVYFAAVNRIGVERGFEFIGKSKICDPLGRELSFANHRDEQIVYADIDIEFARRKHLVAVPGKHEVHRINDRRPDLYRPIVEEAKTR